MTIFVQIIYKIFFHCTTACYLWLCMLSINISNITHILKSRFAVVKRMFQLPIFLSAFFRCNSHFKSFTGNRNHSVTLDCSIFTVSGMPHNQAGSHSHPTLTLRRKLLFFLCVISPQDIRDHDSPQLPLSCCS